MARLQRRIFGVLCAIAAAAVAAAGCDRATNPAGLFALGLSYMARMAKEAGMPIDVRSPYLVYV